MFAHGSENSAGKKKTGNKIGNGVKIRPKAEIFLGYILQNPSQTKFQMLVTSYRVTCFFSLPGFSKIRREHSNQIQVPLWEARFS